MAFTTRSAGGVRDDRYLGRGHGLARRCQPRAAPGPGRPSLVERVYKFPQGELISVFQSAPLPTGGANADRIYSRLWRLVMVRWLQPAAVRELRSEEEILAAQDRG